MDFIEIQKYPKIQLYFDENPIQSVGMVPGLTLWPLPSSFRWAQWRLEKLLPCLAQAHSPCQVMPAGKNLEDPPTRRCTWRRWVQEWWQNITTKPNDLRSSQIRILVVGFPCSHMFSIFFPCHGYHRSQPLSDRMPLWFRGTPSMRFETPGSSRTHEILRSLDAQVQEGFSRKCNLSKKLVPFWTFEIWMKYEKDAWYVLICTPQKKDTTINAHIDEICHDMSKHV